MDKFLKESKQPQLTQEEINNLNKSPNKKEKKPTFSQFPVLHVKNLEATNLS